MNLQPQLEQAVAEEIAFARNFAMEQSALPLAELRKQGLTIEPAKIVGIQHVLSGTIISFQTSFVINTNYFKKGCKLRLKDNENSLDGVIYDLDAYTLQAFFNETPSSELGDTVRLDFIPDDRTLRCMELGIQFLKEKPEIQQFEKALLGPSNEIQAVVHAELNASQQVALGAILSTENVTTIQGPPGTGKTHTLALAIDALVKKGLRVLVSAPSNTAVDNLSLALINRSVSIVRVGNEEKIHDHVKPYYLDELCNSGHLGKSLEHMQNQLRKAEQLANRHIRNYSPEAAAEKKEARREMRELQRAIRQESKALEQLILDKSQVVCGTPVGLFNNLGKAQQFDVVVIDEAGQCMSPLIWLIAVYGKRLVLCGDPQQLPPTILSEKAKKMGLGLSILEASFTTHPPVILTEQYRMAEPISTIISSLFYENKLINKASNQNGSLNFIDTAGFDAPEELDEANGSYSNSGEIAVLAALIEEQQFDIKNTVIITPYNGQIALLEKRFKEFHISTIDAIQGQEQENVIISLVRSNEDGNIGFLNDYRRMNVAISRTKCNCYMIGDSATLATDNFYSRLLQAIENAGVYRSAWEFV